MEFVRYLVYLAEPLLISAAILLAADGYRTWKRFTGGKEISRVMLLAPALACVLILAAYGILTLAFITDSFWVSEVYAQSSSTLPLLYKIGDPWIGSNGSLLFITVLLALVYGIYRLRGYYDQSRFRTTAWMILDCSLIFFILITLIQSPFRILPGNPPEGVGLNPLLQTAWVLSHPPLIFLGYVFVFFAFALLLAGMISGTGGNPEVKRSINLPLYAAWLLLTAGIALGGLWSYRILGWGGYWAWDPVETASLLPWLALTVYFHLSDHGRDSARKFMLMITFVMVIFATALTRGGFSESVHAFGESPAGFVFLGFAAAGLLIFLWLARGEMQRLFSFSPDTSSLSSVSRFIAAGSLTALLIVCFLGAAAPVAGSLVTGAPVSIRAEFFTLACYPFTLAFVASLIGCNTSLKPERWAIPAVIVLGTGGMLAFTGFPTPDALANFGIPVLIAAGFVILNQGIHSFRMRRCSARFWSKMLVHISVIIILLGVFISSAAQVESRPILATPHSGIDVLDSRVVVDNFTLTAGTGSVYFPRRSLVAPEYSGLKTEVTIRDGTAVHRGPLQMYEYLNHGIVSEPLIISTPTKDLYISMHGTNSSHSSLLHALVDEMIPPQDVIIVVKYVPLVWLVWLGLLLMGTGMSAVCLDELLRQRLHKIPRREPEPDPGCRQ